VNLPEKNADCERFEAPLMNVSWSGIELYWRWHWPVVQTSPCLHSNHRKTF